MTSIAVSVFSILSRKARVDFFGGAEPNFAGDDDANTVRPRFPDTGINGTLWMSTSFPGNSISLGILTAWLRPFIKIRACVTVGICQA